MENEITKINLIKTCNNDMQYCRYYVVYFRLYNEDHKKYRKGHFIMQIDAYDILEYFDKETDEKGYWTWTEQEWNEYKYARAYSKIEGYGYNNYTRLYQDCNKTIEEWNKSISHYISIYTVE